jgi:hypothetical protein
MLKIALISIGLLAGAASASAQPGHRSIKGQELGVDGAAAP